MTLEGFIIVVAILFVSFFFLCWFDQRDAGLSIRTPDIKPPKGTRSENPIKKRYKKRTEE